MEVVLACYAFHRDRAARTSRASVIGPYPIPPTPRLHCSPSVTHSPSAPPPVPVPVAAPLLPQSSAPPSATTAPPGACHAKAAQLDFVSLALDCGDGDSSTSTRVFIGGCTFVCVQQYVLYTYAVAYISNLHYQARRKFVGVDGYVPLCLVRRSKNTTTPKGVHVMGFCKLI